MILTENMRAMRLERKLSQTAVANVCGVSRDRYGKYERGEHEPPISVIQCLADYYGVSVDTMLGRTAPPASVPPNKEALLAEFDRLPEKAQDLVLQLMDALANSAAERYPTIIARLHASLASAGFGYDLSNEDEWEEIRILDSPTARRADFAVTVEGDSMEPDFSDGDIVLIKQTPDIEIGQVGLFIHDGKGYIKEYGETCLVSRNPRYPDVEGESQTVGLVLGKAAVV